ncbi:MAG TPA: sigma 54-interacting transcriptional regulator [Myxococcota bacterium]|nr:sigma 54-interacting transcriptional regulator [Myxococcota bacterium]
MSQRLRDEGGVAEQLRKANAFLDAIVENIPDMIFVKEAGSLLFERFNRAGEELLGWTRAELLGKTDHDFYPKEQADFFHAKDRETLRNKKLVDIPEEPITTRAKGLRWLHTKKVPILDEAGEPKWLLGISEDITARKEAEERARALERELASVVQHAREAIMAWRLDGCIVSWNAAAAALYGLRSEQALGMPVEELVPDAERAELRESVGALLAGRAPQISDVVRLRGGRGGHEIEVEESLFLVRDPAGQPARIASIARDRTELARLRRATEILAGTDRHAGDQADDETRSPIMREVLAAADVVAADERATVLLLGETGVGKGWLARRIHARSPRAKGPFLEVNCASLGPQLVESELFGHEKGSFTGATAQKRGLVEAAEGGTLFLDEIGELPPGVQAQLLTFLDQRTFRRVGGVRTLATDVRILAATNVDMKAAAERGTLRKDLYYRLSVIPLQVPPLRDRPEDISALARAMLRGLVSGGTERRRVTLDRRFLRALQRYAWPGNVRELRNALERALILSRGGTLELGHLPEELRAAAAGGGAGGTAAGTRLDELERRHIRRVLEECGGNRTRAAEVLGLSRSTLKRKLAALRGGR